MIEEIGGVPDKSDNGGRGGGGRGDGGDSVGTSNGMVDEDKRSIDDSN